MWRPEEATFQGLISTIHLVSQYLQLVNCFLNLIFILHKSQFLLLFLPVLYLPLPNPHSYLRGVRTFLGSQQSLVYQVEAGQNPHLPPVPVSSLNKVSHHVEWAPKSKFLHLVMVHAFNHSV